MEKFRIAQYGLMQVAAIIYGVLSCAAVIRLCKPLTEMNVTNVFYDKAMFYKNYGAILLLVPLAWSIFCAVRSEEQGDKQLSEIWIAASGWTLFILFVIIGSILAFGAGAQMLDTIS
jgi:hypothetical protein